MPLIDAAGVQVNFPFDPYACQLAYMEKVVTCLKKGHNGILESPTGTGKTLCLLCASLAWLEDKRAQIVSQRSNLANTEPGANPALTEFREVLSKQLDTAAGAWTGELAPPKIIYASRTHSQLTQAIQELKRTAYSHFKVCVLGSREQLCIHPQIMKEENNTSKVHLCRAKVQNRSCHFHNQLEVAKGNFTNKVLDIEDLVNLGQKHNCCPYYAARELKAEADIIFMPYNYLLDVKSRRAHGVELQGNIVIFDEAHNLEKICEESASFDLRSADIAAAMRELSELSDKVLEWVREEEGSSGHLNDSQHAITEDFNLKDLLQLKAMLADLEEQLEAVTLRNPTEGVTKPGSFIFEIFSKINLSFSTKSAVLTTVEKIIQHITNEAQTGIFHSRGAGLSKFADVIKIVFSRDMEESAAISNHQKLVSKHYKVHVRQEEPKKSKKSDGWGSVASSAKPGRVLSYWCFSPGHAMQDLRDHGVKCVILTSGTLAPLSSFKSEMGITFHVELENPHVIEKHQVWIGTVGKGPDGTVLNSSYENRFKESYQSSLGNAIVNFARVVPSGLLIFFPSYTIMDKCLSHWQGSNIWSRIEQYKPIFVEPRHKAEFHTAMLNFYEKINDPTLNGAIFAAVCRGKVSEGLDFADNNGRAVVITGLPFPPRMDPKVMLKMQFLDEMRRQGGQGLTGQDWYRQQATRAVNQAIGRVIRHRQDYGAIILCDNRFGTPTSRQQLPLWVRPQATVYEAFGKAVREVMMFFKQAEKTMPTPGGPKVRVPTSTARANTGAYFMPTISRTSTESLERASTVATHVPSLKPKPAVMSTELSLAKMKEQYKQTCAAPSTSTVTKRGLLDALSHTEVAGRSGSQTFNDTQVPSYQAELKQSQAKPKKKIVLKKSDNQSDVFKDRLQTAEAYINEVKQSLGRDSYTYFSKTLAEYKKTENFASLVSCLVDVFTLSKGSHHLFRSFYRFVRPQHKEQFDRTCREIIGQGCGFKPNHALPKKRPASEGGDGQDKRPRQETEDTKDTKETKEGRETMDTKGSSKNAPISTGGKHLDTTSHLNHGQGQSGAALCDGSLPLGGSMSDKSHTIARSSAGSSTSAGGCPRAGDQGGTDAGGGSPAVGGTGLAASGTGANCDTTSPPGGLTTAPPGGISENLDPAADESSSPLALLGSSLREQARNLGSRANQGYTCCLCHEFALVPLKGPCGHVCCCECWKEAIRLTKSCPDCGQKLKKKHLARLFFASGPNRK